MLKLFACDDQVARAFVFSRARENLVSAADGRTVDTWGKVSPVSFQTVLVSSFTQPPTDRGSSHMGNIGPVVFLESAVRSVVTNTTAS